MSAPTDHHFIDNPQATNLINLVSAELEEEENTSDGNVINIPQWCENLWQQDTPRKKYLWYVKDGIEPMVTKAGLKLRHLSDHPLPVKKKQQLPEGRCIVMTI